MFDLLGTDLIRQRGRAMLVGALAILGGMFVTGRAMGYPTRWTTHAKLYERAARGDSSAIPFLVRIWAARAAVWNRAQHAEQPHSDWPRMLALVDGGYLSHRMTAHGANYDDVATTLGAIAHFGPSHAWHGREPIRRRVTALGQLFGTSTAASNPWGRSDSAQIRLAGARHGLEIFEALLTRAEDDGGDPYRDNARGWRQQLLGGVWSDARASGRSPPSLAELNARIANAALIRAATGGRPDGT